MIIPASRRMPRSSRLGDSTSTYVRIVSSTRAVAACALSPRMSSMLFGTPVTLRQQLDRMENFGASIVNDQPRADLHHAARVRRHDGLGFRGFHRVDFVFQYSSAEILMQQTIDARAA